MDLYYPELFMLAFTLAGGLTGFGFGMIYTAHKYL